MGLKQQGTNNVVKGAEDAFGFTILWRGVWARHLEVNAIGEKKGAGGGVIELATVVTLHAADVSGKLSLDISKEMGQSAKSVGFKA